RTEINSETEVETETEVRPSETRTDEASAAENTDEDTEENAEPTLDEQVAAENDQTNKEALQELRSAQTELQAVLADTALSPAERLAKLQDLKARCAQAARDIETQQNANAALNQPNNGPVTTALLADIEATEQQIS